MRSLRFLAVLVPFLCPVVANAAVLAVCGNEAGLNPASYGLLGTAETGTPEGAPGMTPLALWRDADGFDVLLNWGQQDQRSLRSEGAEIMGNELGPDLIHLVVVPAGAHRLEHFLFSLDDHAEGELIWNAPDALGNNTEVVTACARPKY